MQEVFLSFKCKLERKHTSGNYQSLSSKQVRVKKQSAPWLCQSFRASHWLSRLLANKTSRQYNNKLNCSLKIDAVESYVYVSLLVECLGGVLLTSNIRMLGWRAAELGCKLDESCKS